MTQFKERLFKERLNEKQRDRIQESLRKYNTSLWLTLPRDCPESCIVYGEKNCNFKQIAAQIYIKYIKRGGIHATNIEWSTWRGLADLIESNRWQSNEEYDDPLNL